MDNAPRGERGVGRTIRGCVGCAGGLFGSAANQVDRERALPVELDHGRPPCATEVRLRSRDIEIVPGAVRLQLGTDDSKLKAYGAGDYLNVAGSKTHFGDRKSVV